MSTPSFGKPQTNPFGLADVGRNSSPTFADIDGDGDLDIFVGEWAGSLRYQENQSTASSPTFGTKQFNPFASPPASYHSRPTFADLDGDGDLDIFVGEREGNLIYQENQDTASSPTFGTPQTNPFGLANVGLWSDPHLRRS
ncbi:MAG: hypothetical protein EBE86_005640 [Hormoscilla sp. GUM202]|nr:hypothetical protein [Hormoscilla sp. GUM202]